MQYVFFALGMVLGPRGCLALLGFVLIELLVGFRFGGNAPAWSALMILLLAMLPIGMKQGRAGVLRAFQAMLALLMLVFGVMAFVSFFNQGVASPRAWYASVALVVCFAGRRALGTMIVRIDPDAV